MILLYGNGSFANELNALLHIKNINCKLIDISDLSSINLDNVILASGKPHIKVSMFEEINRFNPKFHKMSLSTDVYSPYDFGTVISLSAVVSNNCTIGQHILINYNATIGHDVTIQNFTTIGPNAFIGGNCKIGFRSYIGACVSVRENIVIGDDCMIGMGAVVVKDVPNNSIVMGNPGIIKPKKES